MKLNFLIPILAAIILGYICATFILNEYDLDAATIDNSVYFLQVGAYNNLDSSKNDLTNIKNKITVKENNKYYSYIGITASSIQADKIKNMYAKNNIPVYIKKNNIENNDFINQLIQYDILLDNSKNIEEINSILQTVLASYEELLTN